MRAPFAGNPFLEDGYLLTTIMVVVGIKKPVTTAVAGYFAQTAIFYWATLKTTSPYCKTQSST
jgi:hypothetical protein